MKIVHFTAYNGSGMNQVAVSCVESERAAGLDSHLLNIHESSNWDIALDADVHVAHTHWPDFYNGKSFRRMLKKTPKIVTIFHGTPEFVIRDTMNLHRHNPKHGNGDGIMMMLHWLSVADARITFWPRHQAIYQTMVDRGTAIDLLPLGVDREFWKSGSRSEYFPGNPSVWSGENPHFIKDPLDLALLWPWVYPQLDNASLHLCYLAENLHRHYSPILNRNQAAYGMHWSAFTFRHERLRNIFKSIDFFAGLVRYGDFNRLSLEAAASGVKTISYRGNPYADFWITEGDQRVMALELLTILRGDVEPRAEKSPVPDVAETASEMQRVYERVLARPVFPGFELPFSEPKNWHAPSFVDTRSPEVIESAARSAIESTGTPDFPVPNVTRAVRTFLDRHEPASRQREKRSRMARPHQPVRKPSTPAPAKKKSAKRPAKTSRTKR